MNRLLVLVLAVLTALMGVPPGTTTASAAIFAYGLWDLADDSGADVRWPMLGRVFEDLVERQPGTEGE